MTFERDCRKEMLGLTILDDPTHLDAKRAATAFPGVHIDGIPLCWLQEILEQYRDTLASLDDAELAFDPPMETATRPADCPECIALATA